MSSSVIFLYLCDLSLPYPADDRLHDGVQSSLRGVQVTRDLLLAHLLLEPLGLVRQRENVAETEGWLTFF